MSRQDPTVSPWEALLNGVSSAVARAAWVDTMLANAVHAATTESNDGADPSESRAVQYWLKTSRLERQLSAKTAQAAIQAGVAERMVRQVEMEGRMVAGALAAALDSLELSPEQRFAAMEVAHSHLLAGAGDIPPELPPPTP